MRLFGLEITRHKKSLSQVPVSRGWWPLTAEVTYFHLRMDDEILYDPFVFQNDNFTVVFDTYRDLRSGFFFALRLDRALGYFKETAGSFCWAVLF